MTMRDYCVGMWLYMVTQKSCNLIGAGLYETMIQLHVVQVTRPYPVRNSQALLDQVWSELSVEHAVTT